MEVFKRDWFANPQWWFAGTTYDALLTERYAHLLDGCICCEDDLVAMVLLYDQLPRHIFRDHGNHIVTFFLQKALPYAERAIEMKDPSVVTAQEWSFLMLPLRHAGEVDKATRETWKRLRCATEEKEIAIYKRFLRASYERANTTTQPIEVYHGTSKPFDHNILHHRPCRLPKRPHANMLGAIAQLLSPCRKLIVSLSGGVDSMVILEHAKHIYRDYEIVATHINYNNRSGCMDEVAFLCDWCAHLGVPLYVRTITEINRKDARDFEMRELYETYTRDVRYNTYKCVWKLVGGAGEPHVVLGHNRDDCFENIMTNMTFQSKYEDLRGMDTRSVQDGIVFLRPFLGIPKDAIIGWAQANHIPFLGNSTPPWSQRGKIRASVIPVLAAWNPQSVDGLHAWACVTQQLFKTMERRAKAFADEWTCDGYTGSRTILEEDSPIFWRCVFRHLGEFRVSAKSLANFVATLRSATTRKIVLSKTFSLMISITETQIKIRKNETSV